MDMPQVKLCNAAKCAFNKDNACHALAVTIGDDLIARCDTYLVNGSHGGILSEIAGVGACKMEDCTHNKGLYCRAPAIEVKYTKNGPVCATYSPAMAHAKV